MGAGMEPADGRAAPTELPGAVSGPSVAQGAVARARVPGLALPRPVEAVDLVSSLELDSGRTSARARLRALAAAGGGNGGGSRQASARARGGDSSARAVAAVAGVSLTGAADTQAAPAVAVQPHAQPQATRPHSKSMPPLSQAAARASDLRAIAGSGDDPAAAEAAATQARRDAARQALLRREGRESFISRVGDTLDLPRQARYQLGTEQRRFMGGEATGEASGEANAAAAGVVLAFEGCARRRFFGSVCTPRSRDECRCLRSLREPGGEWRSQRYPRLRSIPSPLHNAEQSHARVGE